MKKCSCQTNIFGSFQYL